MKTFNEMKEKINKQNPSRIAVAAAEDKEVLLAVKEAISMSLAEFHLIGNEELIKQLAKEIDLDLNEKAIEITNVTNPIIASLKAVESVSSNKSQILMKGLVPTATILKAVLDKDIGLRTGKVLSHVALFELESYDRFLLLTDGAMNIAPNLEQKVQIVENSVDLAFSVGVKEPKVALIAAVETVNPNMQATIDASLISKMGERGQIKGAVIDGPLALDNAISLEAAEHKGIKSNVAGRADILVVPSIEVGNVLYKSLVYFANSKVGAVIMGATAPIVLTSRADTHDTKLNSIILAVLSAQQKH